MIEEYKVRLLPNISRSVRLVQDPSVSTYNIHTQNNTSDETLYLTFDNSDKSIEVSTVLDPMADSAYTIYTQSTTEDATLYLTLVDSNNTPASKETVYTNSGLTYNPSIRNLSIGSSVQISPDRLSYGSETFYIGNGSITGITSFSGKIRLGGNSILSSSDNTVVSFAGTATEFKGDVTVLGNFNTNNINAGIVTATKFVSPFTGTASSIFYNAQGQVESLTYANGSIKTLTYDAEGKLTQSSHASGTRVLQKSFFYDAQSRLINIAEVIQ